MRAKKDTNVEMQAGDYAKFPVNQPPALESADLPELLEEDIAGFLEMAQMMMATKAVPFAGQAATDEKAKSLAEESYLAILRAEGEHRREKSPSLIQNEEASDPEWKYKDIKTPPPWLEYTHTKGGLPTTRPPAVPKMIPPPPPLAFPANSYTSRHSGPYAPQPVPSYSIGAPPPVPAANWLPLAAYIQPPKDAVQPDQ